MTQFWYGLGIGFVTGFFEMFILAVLFIRFYNRASEDERKYDDDRFMDMAITMKNGEKNEHHC